MTASVQKRAHRHRCAQRLRAWRQLPCERCHTTKMTREFAHLVATPLSGRGRGALARYYDLCKHPHAYALLCGTCHLHLDLGVIAWSRLGKPSWL